MKRAFSIGLRAVLFGSFLLLAPPLRAADDVADAQKIISAQAEAFDRDDAVAAYSHASPEIQRQLAQDDFMAMVRNGYAPVYRHKRFDFAEGKVADGKITQLVNIVDASGVAWEALYTLERQADGSLKITGCTLLKAGQTV